MSERKNYKLAGLLFLISTTSIIAGDQLMSHLLNQLTHSIEISPYLVVLASFLMSINSIAVVWIAVGLYPTIERTSKRIALGYTVSRVIEATLLAVGIAVLALATYHPEIISVAQNANRILFQFGMEALSVGSLFFCYILLKKRMIPSILAWLGIIGYFALFCSCWFVLLEWKFVSALYIPGAIFEVVFPIWLIIKGIQTKD